MSASDPEGRSGEFRCRAPDDDDLFKTYDIGVSVGAGMSFDIGGIDLVAEALYTFGILNILAEDSDVLFKNRGFAFRLGMDVAR